MPFVMPDIEVGDPIIVHWTTQLGVKWSKLGFFHEIKDQGDGDGICMFNAYHNGIEGEEYGLVILLSLVTSITVLHEQGHLL